MSHKAGTLANFADYLTQLKAFLCGSVSQSYSGTGNGTMTLLDPRPGIIDETWTIECIAESPNEGIFSVTGSVSGPQADAHVGVEYDNGFIRFKINDGSVDFNADSPADAFTVIALASPLAGTLAKTSFAGTGDGVCTRLSASTKTVTENWTLTATSATNFTVTGSVSGAQAAATVGTEYDNGYIRFLLRAGTTPFVATDEFVLAAARLVDGGQTYECLYDSDVRSDFADVTLGYIGAGNYASATSGPFQRRIYFKSTGLVGDDTIYHCYSSLHSTTSYFNIRLNSLLTFDPLLALPAQSVVSQSMYMCLDNSATNTYRFIATGRCVSSLVKVGSIYESCMSGYLFPNGSPTDYPYPLMCGGSSYTPTLISSAQTVDHGAFYQPRGTAGLAGPSHLQFLARSGSVWINASNYTAASAQQAWPSVLLYPLAHLAGYGSQASSADYRPLAASCYGNTDKILRPISVWSSVSGYKGYYGDLDGVYHVSGQGAVAEDVVNVDEVDYLLWPAAFYDTRESYAAFKLA